MMIDMIVIGTFMNKKWEKILSKKDQNFEMRKAMLPKASISLLSSIFECVSSSDKGTH